MAISVLAETEWLESVPTAMQAMTDRTISMCRLCDLMAIPSREDERIIAREGEAFMTNRAADGDLPDSLSVARAKAQKRRLPSCESWTTSQGRAAFNPGESLACAIFRNNAGMLNCLWAVFRPLLYGCFCPAHVLAAFPVGKLGVELILFLS